MNRGDEGANAPKKQQLTTIYLDEYGVDASYFASKFDFMKEDLERNRLWLSKVSGTGTYKTAVWFIPHFTYAYYGGIYTILRFAEFLTRKYGMRHTFVVQGVSKITKEPDMIKEAFPLLASSRYYPLTNEQSVFSHIPDHDIGFCTAWQTAYPLLKFNRVRKKLYFMQDFEPYFYPAGSISGLAEATYRFGFTAICNTEALKESYEAYGGKAVHFSPAVDRTVFYPADEAEETKDKYRIIFYGRPFGIRNCFELAIEAIKRVKNDLGDQVEIISAGGGWKLRDYGLENIVRNLDRLPYEKTGDLYRSCDVGLALMMTRHTSYIPLELMACGCLVVTNRSRWKNWLLRNRENCLLSEPSVSCLAETIMEGLSDHKLRRTLVQNAYRDIEEKPGWDEEFERVMKEIFND